MSWLTLGFGYAVVYVVAEQWLDVTVIGTWFRVMAFIAPPVLAISAIAARRDDWRGCQGVFWGTVGIGLTVSTVGFLGWTLDGFLLQSEPSPLREISETRR